MQIERYTSDRAQEWDEFVAGSKNGTFLFLRAYMDYHADRFQDHSLMFYSEKGKLLSVLPANEKDGVLYSHQGLTYGGFITTADTRASEVEMLFATAIDYLKNHGFIAFFYKAIPTIYHKYPAEEDEYWLWRNGAEMIGCNLACSVPLNETIPMERRRNRGIKKAENLGYHIIENADLDIFWPIMLNNLREKYDATPVHSLAEMKLLHDKLPDRIEVFLCNDANDEAQAGAVVYLANSNVVHVQYAHATQKGKDDGAIDLIYAYLIKKYKNQGYKYFDIGTSNEDGGKILNASLIAQKEGFGGRGIACKTFLLKV